MVYIHDKYMQDEKQFSWDSMYHSDPHVIQKLSDVMDRLIQDRINDFIGPFATLDAVLTNVDICKTFTDYLISIGVTLAAADGYISQEEEEAIKRRIYDVFFENWQECLRRLKTTL